MKRANVQPQVPQVPAGLDAALQRYDNLEAAKKRADEEAEFAARLELIKLEAAQKRAAGAVPAAATAAAAVSNAAPRAVFDAPVSPEDDMYANPPSILSTLQDQLQSDINDPALRQAKIGPGQAGLALGAVLFGLVFVLVSGGDFASTNRYKGLRPARPPPDPIEMSQLAKQAEGFKARLQQNPKDLQSLEAAAVTYARMQDFDDAADLLDKLTAARPDDVEAWRLLGESRLLMADAAKSVAAYEKAVALSLDNQQIITGLVDAYVANSQQAKAVNYLTKVRDRVLSEAGKEKARSAAATATTSSSSGEAAADAAAPAAAMPGSGNAMSSNKASTSQAADAPSTSQRTVDPIAVQLLLGKSYAAWRGHDQDALAAYDTLIGAFPTDFRGYLAKGVFLKERGRQADAERMFLQAKFYAPDSLQAFVNSRAGERPDLGPLPDNGLE
eukprot:GHRR01028068.1.p1 GENE.GHRR01028068.1~~GHRR01028068.1.p1  ORF type:complete len:444 (+),score=218.28 GHRR01028068.1:833-2164(+)